MSKTRKPEFRPDEFVVYPAHGVGRIISIEEQEIAGLHMELFVISFEKDKMTLRVPTHKASDIGMRSLSSPDVVTKALDTLKGKARVKRAMWSRRAQEYEQKINSGDPSPPSPRWCATCTAPTTSASRAIPSGSSTRRRWSG